MISGNGFAYEKIYFPCGEMHVRILSIKDFALSIDFEFERNEEIVELLLVCDAIKNAGREISEIRIPYVPFGRQDRVAVGGDCFSLRVFSGLINGIGIKRVVITDPHSDVTTALINNCVVIKQSDLFSPMLKNKKGFWIVSPDAGALKKATALAGMVNSLGVLECSKKRNVQTGAISGIKIEPVDLEMSDAYIVDDICDGGKTFVEISKKLRGMNCGKIILFVSHGFFTKGLGVFDGLIDEIYTRKGRVK